MQGSEDQFKGYCEDLQTLPSGLKYSGNWSEGAPHGLGKLMLENSTIFEGRFVKGWREGKGKVIYENGDYLEAHWK